MDNATNTAPPNDANNDEDERIECPCANFTAMSKIVDVLNDSKEQRMQSLLDWLEGGTDARALEQNRVLSCGKRSRCRFRYGTSFAILNAIRDACRPYLEQPTSSTTTANSNVGITTEGFSNGGKVDLPPVVYEEAFPALTISKPTTKPGKPHPAASNILVPRKKSSSDVKKNAMSEPNLLVPTKKKNKRRIRPQPAGAVVTTNSIWGGQQSSAAQFGSYHGNIASLPSQDPLTVVKKLVSPEKLAVASINVLTPKKKTRPQSVDGVQSLSAADTPTKKESLALTTPGGCTKASDKLIEHLVEVYVAMIRNLLVPSTALELHLLIRLLTVDTDPCTAPSNKTNDASSSTIFLQPILSGPKNCKRFSQLALSKLKPILRNLSVPLIKVLVQCEPFRRECPELTQDLNIVLEERIRAGLSLAEYSSDAVTGTHAILSLPFEHGRDSRHNYRTQAEVAVYKNREESRDSFLYELRTFMGVKGKVLRPQEMERAQERVRQESKTIMNRLLSVNMIWFAQFYCELLLQVGLSPVEETDQELLSIADKDKLQRLHKRFSSRNPHSSANKSSKKLALSQKSEATSLSPLNEAQTHFPGYQEFFFLFLHQLPYNFGTHLRSRMAATMIDLTDNLATNNLERRIMDLQLFARFLGFLMFSPNWHGTGIDSSKMQSSTMLLTDGLQQLESLDLSLTTILEEAWKEGHTVSTVPWITELLKMAKWDSLSQTSRKFRQLLSNLRMIQDVVTFVDGAAAATRFGPSMEVVSFYLESFFHETIGLAKLTSLPKAILPSIGALPSSSLDVTAIGFSTVTLFSSSPHLEDLSNLVNALCRSQIGKSPSKSRKLRPSIVSSAISLEPNRLFTESTSDGKIFSNMTDWNSSKSSAWAGGFSGEGRSIQTKLVDAFFHQHREVKEVCEFAVNQVLKNNSSQVLGACIKPAFEERKITIHSSEQEFEDAQRQALDLSTDFLRSRLEKSVRMSLEILGPHGLHPKVSKIATTLAVTRGVHSGQALLHALVSNESKTLRESLEREKKKLDSGKSLALTKEASKEKTLEETILSIEALESCFRVSSSSWNYDDVHRCVYDVDTRVETFVASIGSAIPSESSLRSLFELLLRLDRTSPCFTRWSLGLEANKSYAVLSAFLRFATNVFSFSNYGLKRFSESLNIELLTHFIGASLGSSNPTEVVSLLQNLIEARIITLCHLKGCLDSSDVVGQVREVVALVESSLVGN
jgi:hypothetical protein